MAYLQAEKWPICKLGKLLVDFVKKNKNDEAITVYSVTNEQGFTISTEYFSKEVFSKNLTTYKIVEKGDFAYNPSRINVGSIDYFKNNGKGLVSPLYVTFKIKENLDEKFLKYYLKSPFGNAEIRNNTSGSVRDSLAFASLSKIIISLPPLEYQKRIVRELDAADALRQKRKQAIALLDDYLKAVFLEMFGDPVTNPKRIKKMKIREMGKVVTGNTPPRNVPENYGDYIEWIKSDNLNNEAHYLTKAKESLSELGLKRARTVPKGSILVTCIAGSVGCIGNVGMADREVSFNQQINAIVPNTDVEQSFLYSQILFNKKLFQKASTNSMKGMLSKTSFSEIELMKPDTVSQKKYSEIFYKIEQLKQVMVTQAESLEANFNALMQTAFKS